MSNTEINRHLATEVMEAEWHELKEVLWLASQLNKKHKTPHINDHIECTCGKTMSRHELQDHCIEENPCYLHNLSDRQDLLEACTKKKWWWDFIVKQSWILNSGGEGRRTLDEVFIALLIPRDALATAIYRYLKEKKE
jgi:hypothetical protein